MNVSLSPVDDLPAPRWSACDYIEGCQVMYCPDTEEDTYQVFGGHTAAGPTCATEGPPAGALFGEVEDGRSCP